MYRLEEEINFLIEESKVDWISLSEVIVAANEASDAVPFAGRLERVLSLVPILLERGFVCGNLAGPAGFRAWPDQTAGSVCHKIEAVWNEVDRNPEGHAGYVVWFDRPASRL